MLCAHRVVHLNFTVMRGKLSESVYTGNHTTHLYKVFCQPGNCWSSKSVIRFPPPLPSILLWHHGLLTSLQDNIVNRHIQIPTQCCHTNTFSSCTYVHVISREPGRTEAEAKHWPSRGGEQIRFPTQSAENCAFLKMTTLCLRSVLF